MTLTVFVSWAIRSWRLDGGPSATVEREMPTRSEQKRQGLSQLSTERIRRPVVHPTTLTASLHHACLPKLREVVGDDVLRFPAHALLQVAHAPLAAPDRGHQLKPRGIRERATQHDR